MHFRRLGPNTKKVLILMSIVHAYHLVWKSDAKEIPTSKPRRFQNAYSDMERWFFQRIQILNLDWHDILGPKQNVLAAERTTGCPSVCRTTIALWVLQSLQPCAHIYKADCPKGLVCCMEAPSEDQISNKGSSQKDSADDEAAVTEDDTNDALDDIELPPPTKDIFIPFLDENNELYYPEPILDPIPNDESFETLKV